MLHSQSGTLDGQRPIIRKPNFLAIHCQMAFDDELSSLPSCNYLCGRTANDSFCLFSYHVAKLCKAFSAVLEYRENLVADLRFVVGNTHEKHSRRVYSKP